MVVVALALKVHLPDAIIMESQWDMVKSVTLNCDTPLNKREGALKLT